MDSMVIDFPELNIPLQEADQIPIPKMYRVRQHYDRQRIDDVEETLRRELELSITNKEQFRGKRLALTVGSRGIPALDRMVKVICDCAKSWGAYTFIFPAMVSHGGATAGGQRAVLAEYGIT